jgi:hypothetical protein
MSTSPDIVQELKEAGTPLLLQAERENPYKVPAGYFDTLPQKVLSLVNDSDRKEIHAELEALAPLLNKISKEGPYEIPRGYFHQSLNKKASTRPSTSKLATLNYLSRLAAAAVISGIILIALYKGTNQSRPGNDTVHIPSTISETALHEFLDNEASSGSEFIDSPMVSTEWVSDNTQDLFEGVSLQELEQFSQQFNAYSIN